MSPIRGYGHLVAKICKSMLPNLLSKSVLKIDDLSFPPYKGREDDEKAHEFLFYIGSH